jgi:hypothetical protein
LNTKVPCVTKVAGQTREVVDQHGAEPTRSLRASFREQALKTGPVKSGAADGLVAELVDHDVAAAGLGEL